MTCCNKLIVVWEPGLEHLSQRSKFGQKEPSMVGSCGPFCTRSSVVLLVHIILDIIFHVLGTIIHWLFDSIILSEPEETMNVLIY